MTFRRFKIGEIFTLVRGTYPTMKTPPGPYPLVVTAAFRRSANSYQLEGPAVCVPLISSTGHGDAALHRVYYQEGKFALANLLVALVPKNLEVCYAKYVYYLLMAKKNEYFVPLMLGTANVSLKEKDIAGVEIALPSLEEQQRTVAHIETLSSQILEAQTMRQQASEETKAIVIAKLREMIRNCNDRVRYIPFTELVQLERRPVKIELDQYYKEIGVYSFGRGIFHKEPRTGAEVGDKNYIR